MEVSDKFAGLVAATIEEGKQRWPSVRLERDTFASYLEARVDDDDALARVQALDLYLACACSEGLPGAIATFRETFLPAAEAHLRTMRAPAATIEDVLSRLTEELFASASPKIRQYAGRSALRVWLQVVITRMALRMLEHEKRYLPLDEAPSDLTPEVAGPELAYLKGVYRDAFKTAFEEAARDLSSRDRNLLRYQYVDGLTGDEIAALYGTHRATVVRWAAKAREALLVGTRDKLLTRLAVEPSEFASIARLVQSQLDFSIRSLLSLQDD